MFSCKKARLMYYLPYHTVNLMESRSRIFFCCCYILPFFPGFFAYVVSVLGFVAAVYFKVPVTIVYDKFLQLLTSAIVFSAALAVFVYIKARLGPTRNLAPAGNSGR